MRMTHASVFSGIGGPEVAASMLGWENLFHCEINPFGKAVLDYWYPNAKSYDDITKTDFREWRGRINVLTGGFPCQPFSYAGKRKGADDDRYLWPHMFRCIDEIRPDWVVAENVAGILTMVEQGEVSSMANQATLFDEADNIRGIYQLRETFTLQRICDDLTSHGYSVQPILIPACAVGAPHRRDRVFIVARRIASDSDNRADGRTAREDEGKGREERIQERHKVRNPDEPNQVRPEGATIPQDSMHSRQLYGQDEVEGCERNIGNVGAGGGERICSGTSGTDSTHPDSHRGCEVDEHLEPEQPNGAEPFSDGREWNAADTDSTRLERDGGSQLQRHQGRQAADEYIASGNRIYQVGERWANFPTVSPVHRGNDGLPFDVDNLTIPFPKWRTEALKAYGNAIVPQVMYEIFRAIQEVESHK